MAPLQELGQTAQATHSTLIEQELDVPIMYLLEFHLAFITFSDDK